MKFKSIIDYIEEVADYSFDFVPFNEIDSAIFASLSYINFEGILKLHSSSELSIFNAGTIFFSKYSKKELKSNVFSVQTGIKIFSSIYKTKRYRDLTLNKYVKVVDHDKQFQTVCININKRLSYISFEGTDDLVSGWMEDAKMSYQYPVPSQKEAIRYVNAHINPFLKRIYILGGHSKGGNLALTAGMNMRKFCKTKIKKIYMFDAPGLKEEQVNSNNYKSIEGRIIRIIPNYSVVGLLFNFTTDYKVTSSNKKGVMAHNMINWAVNGYDFKKDNLSKFSEKFKNGIDDWLSTYDDETREVFVRDLFDIFKRANINSLLDIKKNTLKNLVVLIKESKKMDKNSKEIINAFLKFLVEFLKEESGTLISSKIPKIKH